MPAYNLLDTIQNIFQYTDFQTFIGALVLQLFEEEIMTPLSFRPFIIAVYAYTYGHNEAWTCLSVKATLGGLQRSSHSHKKSEGEKLGVLF